MFSLRSRKKKKQLMLSKTARNLITVSDTKSIISEQFRTIRANITFSMPDQELKTILVTSSTPGEGKSTNAANLGVVFAQEGKRVLIIDGDLRKPTLHQTFKTFNNVGLSNVIAKKATLNEAIQETFIFRLHVLTSGPIPPNPAELLSSKSMDALILDVKRDFDIVIIDAPPLLSVSDAQILANKCDGTVLIVNTGVVEKEAVRKAHVILSNSQSIIIGVVLNNYVTPKHQHYYKEYSLSE
ncbi:CpsD/CapB family tyrosine-protein kinase [Solibacillus daqui]|uniref:CpsD/CapB family tyrosine-protein kinase n=1 Tax=Solibacillus daqui TaxID=2912187 RepID=UPI0023655470|nr:CpsD/CapB family tyrosine-protein kinase [Solibacillus daqui]